MHQHEDNEYMIGEIHNNQLHIRRLVSALKDEFGQHLFFTTEEAGNGDTVKLNVAPCTPMLCMSMNNFLKGFRLGCNPENGPTMLPRLTYTLKGNYMVSHGNCHYYKKTANDAVRQMKELWANVQVN